MIKNCVVKIYTDGACRGNPGVGGWGAVLYYDKHTKKIHGTEKLTTNNRMELTAAIEALAILKRSCDVELYTDSNYLKQGITEWLENWKKNNWRTANKMTVKNIDLWQKLSAEANKHKIKWHWVKGHAGNVNNEIADALANEAIDKICADK